MIIRQFLLALALLVFIGCQADTGTQTWSSKDAPQAPSVYHSGAVAADHALASQAGLEMLQRGGNAVDAAVATSFCLSVVRPFSCGIGGGGFMLIHLPSGENIAINYRESAPGKVGPDYYESLAIPGASRFGVHAVGVPGTVAGLLFALERYGTLDRETVMAPAIRHATNGFLADTRYAKAAREVAKVRNENPWVTQQSSYVWRQLCLHGNVQPGSLIRQPLQARALRLIARDGASAFYDGPIGEAIVEAMNEHGGPITTDDLRGYTIRTSEPLRSEFRGLELLTMPPPSSGGIAMQQVCGILDRRIAEIDAASPSDDAYLHLLAESFKHAFADRGEWLADSDFVSVPTERLTSPAYLDARAGSIDLHSTQPPEHYGTRMTIPTDGGTSHVSVVDSGGMAVAMTETINLEFGSLVAVPGYGIVLNDEMDDFSTIPGAANAFGLVQSDRNAPAPGKRPLSSMSPTIVLKDGRPFLIAGASGGPRIITGTLQAVLNSILFDMPPAQAVAQPRVHHQYIPAALQFEHRWPDDGVRESLESRGHDVGARDEVGVVQLIRVDDDGIRAASDPRKGGVAVGY